MSFSSDFNQLAQSFGVFAQSVNSLINVKRELASERISATLEQGMNDIKARMFQKVGDPSKITQENWREAWSEFEALKNDLVSQYEKDFHTSDYVKTLTARYDEKFMNTFVADYYQAYRDSTAKDFFNIYTSMANQTATQDDLNKLSGMYDKYAQVLSPQEIDSAKKIYMSADARVNINKYLSAGLNIDGATNNILSDIRSDNNLSDEMKAYKTNVAIEMSDNIKQNVIKSFETKIDNLIKYIDNQGISVKDSIKIFQNEFDDATKYVSKDDISVQTTRFMARFGKEIGNLYGDNIIANLLSGQKETVDFKDIVEAQALIQVEIDRAAENGFGQIVESLVEKKKYIATLGASGDGSGVSQADMITILGFRMMYEKGDIVNALAGIYGFIENQPNNKSKEKAITVATDMLQDLSSNKEYNNIQYATLAYLFNDKDIKGELTKIYSDSKSDDIAKSTIAKAKLNNINRLIFNTISSGKYADIDQVEMVNDIVKSIKIELKSASKEYEKTGNVVYNNETILSALTVNVGESLKIGINKVDVGSSSAYSDIGLLLGDAIKRANAKPGYFAIVKTKTDKTVPVYIDSDNRVSKVIEGGGNTKSIRLYQFTDNEFKELNLDKKYKLATFAREQIIPVK